MLVAAPSIAGTVAVGALLIGGGEQQPAPTDEASTTPDGTVLALYDAMRQGDCATADSLRTEALRSQVATSGIGPSCEELAEWIAEHPERVDEVLPQVSAEVVYESERVAMVDTIFTFSADQPDRVEDAYLVRQEDGAWRLTTRAEAESVEPESPYFAADLVVFVDANVDEAQRTAIESRLDGDAAVQSFVYVDEAASAVEARRLFQDNQAMLDRLATEPTLLPTSYFVALTTDDQATGAAVVEAIHQLPGVVAVEPVPR